MIQCFGVPPIHIVIFNHELGLLGLTLRIEGTKSVFNKTVPNVYINVVSISLDYAQSYSMITPYLEAHLDTQLIVTLGSAGTDPAVAAVENLGLESI